MLYNCGFYIVRKSSQVLVRLALSIFFIKKKGNDFMFEVCETMLKQLVDCFPVIFGVYLIFDFVGSLLFGKS